jgi:uncharacterized protein YbgA (DUF1722 family)
MIASSLAWHTRFRLTFLKKRKKNRRKIGAKPSMDLPKP